MRLAIVDPTLERLLTRGGTEVAACFGVSEIRRETTFVRMPDGTRLATDLYLPPELPAPVVVVRTPYTRDSDANASALIALARRGYAAVAQDCRGTGDSEPDQWDYSVFETADGLDLVSWITAQPWYGGFIGSFGGSYVGQTQWAMALHPAMSTLIPHMSGLGIARNTAHLHMFNNGYARTVGKGTGKLEGVHYADVERLIEHETMTTGYFNEPVERPFPAELQARSLPLRHLSHSEGQRWLWEQYCSMSCAQRAQFVREAFGVECVSSAEVEKLSDIFGPAISHDAISIPYPDRVALAGEIQAPPLLFTGWYDWCLNDALATWEALRRSGRPDVSARTRMIIAPTAHAALGYRVDLESHPELQMPPSAANYLGVFLRWFRSVREGSAERWPTVIYYLMGANEWQVADDWPPHEASEMRLYLADAGALSSEPPRVSTGPGRFTYDPDDPTPTVGGSIVSHLYPPGSVDVSAVQARSDVLTFTSEPLENDLDVVGPLRVVLYASSSAPDTDFTARLSDVFPDGRAIQLQNCILRARYRDTEPTLLAPGQIYRLEIDLWATANRFKAGHRLRVDIASADFPKFDRNSNRGGAPGPPTPATQTIYRDADHPSHVRLFRVQSGDGADR